MTATAVANLNLSTDLNVTPSRKRKRQEIVIPPTDQQKPPTTSCFTNAAFSSTPKKILAKRRLNVPTNSNKENAKSNTFASDIGLEVKSIADIAKESNGQPAVNPYEVLRKPPKKKKRSAEEAACFENPALNLDLPERQFNPYEIVREKTPTINTNCFINSALNLKTKDVPASRNPFEIPREDETKETLPTMPCKLKIGLPFVPNVGCRIDFKDMSMSQLTPSKMLAEKLVFSPVIKSKTSLGSIGEETMDIGRELDRYQLELENSINEAKLRKNVGLDHLVISPLTNTVEIDVENHIKFTQNLTEIQENGETEETTEETVQQHTKLQVIYEQTSEEEPSTITTTNPFENDQLSSAECQLNKNPFTDDINKDITASEDLEDLCGDRQNYDDDDDDVEDTCDDSFDFKAPAPFVRAYTKPISPKLRVSKESLEHKEDKPSEPDDQAKKSMNVKSLIRKSIRKLMHPHQQKPAENIGEEEKLETEKHSHNGFMSSIRQSLRRKPGRTLLQEESSEDINACELSIIDGSERTMKLKSDLIQTEYIKIEDLTNEKKHNLRNSIRRSTRDVGHHLMKSVFHKKHEEYEFSR